MLIIVNISANFVFALNNESIITKYTEDKNELKDNLKDGEVDVNKSVEYKQKKKFQISLLAQAKDFEKITTASKEYNIVFVIDNSGSMYKDSGRIQACVSAINEIIGDLAKYKNIKISVVAYSSGKVLDYTTDDESVKYISNNDIAADDLLPLAHYDASTSIGYVDNYGLRNETNYDYRNTLRWLYSSTGKKLYAGNTNTQAGIVKAYEVLSKANNKETAVPVIMLMSDGEATNYAYGSNAQTDYKYEISTISELESYKDAFSNVYTQSHIPGFATILSANYAKYSLNKIYKNKCQFYTFGYALDKDFENYKFSLATLNPTQSNLNSLKTFLDEGYEKNGLYELLNNSSIANDLKYKYGITNLMYTDKYYEGNTDNIKSVYKDMVNQTITEKEKMNAIKSENYLSIKDTIGDYFDIIKENDNIKMTIIQKSTNSLGDTSKEIILKSDNGKTYTYSDNNFNVTYDLTNNVVDFNIKSEYINNNQIILTYNIILGDRILISEKEETYYTNNIISTYYTFESEDLNPLYKGKIKENLKTTGTISLKEEPEYVTIEIPKDEPLDELVEEKIEEAKDEPLDETVEEKIEEAKDEPLDELVEEKIEEAKDEPLDETVEEKIEEAKDEPLDEPVKEKIEEAKDEPLDEPDEEKIEIYIDNKKSKNVQNKEQIKLPKTGM